MQSIGKFFFQRPRSFGHDMWLGQPIGAVCYIGPCPNCRDPLGQSGDVALNIVEPRQLTSDIFERQKTVALRQIWPQSRDESGMMFLAHLSEIGQARRIPKARYATRPAHQASDFRIFGEPLEHGQVNCLGSCNKTFFGGLYLQIGDQRSNRIKLRLGIAPIEPVEFWKIMVLDCRNFFGCKFIAFAGQCPESAIALMPPCASGNLRHLGDSQPPSPRSVELGKAGESNVRDIEVKAHANGVGRDQIVNLARLEHRDLSVACSRGESAHDHRCTAPQPAKRFGNGVNLLDGKGHDSRAFWQSRELLRAAIAQSRKPRSRDNFGIWQKRADHRAKTFRPKDHSLLTPPRVQHPVGKNVPAFGISTQLRLVDGNKSKVTLDRHRFDGATIPPRIRRFDAFLASYQRDLSHTLDRNNPVVNLARQQAQREPHHSARISTHPLNREVGLSSVGWAKDGGKRSARLGQNFTQMLC